MRFESYQSGHVRALWLASAVAQSQPPNPESQPYNPLMRTPLLLASLFSIVWVPTARSTGITTDSATAAGQSAPPPAMTILKPARVFDGEAIHEGWAVRVRGERIDAVGPTDAVASAG